MTKIKICGLRRMKDIEIVNICKPDFCGFIIDYPQSFRSLTVRDVAALSSQLDRENIRAVGVFVDEPVGIVAELLNTGVIDIAQLHGRETEEYIQEMRELTDKPLIKSFIPADQDDIRRAAASSADHILLDGGRGEGRTFDWSILGAEESLVRCGVHKKAWFMAGGLNEHNITEAVSRFHPYAVDLSSSVETDGVKVEKKIKRVIELVRRIGDDQ